MTTTINFDGDIMIERYWRQFNREDVFEIVRQTRGGKYILRDKFGKECMLPKRNIEALKHA